jgi:fumarylacetoacetate (FAA) hydrolase family protein
VELALLTRRRGVEQERWFAFPTFCAMGPFFRMLDERFTLEHARRVTFETVVEGPDGFRIAHTTQVGEISRDLTELAGQAIGA